MRFSDPEHLLLLLLVAAIAWLYRRARSRRTAAAAPARPPGIDPAPWLRSGVVVVLVLAAAGPEVRTGRPGEAVVFLLDRSESVGPAGAAAATDHVGRALAAMTADDRAGIVVFAREPLVERPLEPPRPFAEARSVPEPGATDIGAAIRLATAILAERPRAGAIVLLSDGDQTAGDALREARVAAARGVRIDVVPVGAGRAPGEVAVTAVEAPARVRVGEPFEIEATVEGERGAEVMLRLYGRAVEAERREVLARDGAHRFRFAARLDRPGLHEFRVTVESPGDPEAGDDEGGAVVVAAGRPRVLLPGPARDRGLLARTLAAHGFEVETAAPAELPRTATALEAYDAVILDDLPAAVLGDGFLAALAEYVADRGGGLLVAGGPGALDAAAWERSAAGAILPVDTRAGSRAPERTVVLILDKSGSMAGEEDGLTKLAAATDAAAALVGALDPGDRVGVVAFDREPVTVMAPRAGADPEAVRALLARLEPGGSTELLPALERARDWLASSPAGGRHAVLLTDGQVGAATPDELRRRIEGTGIVLSAVGIGPDADRELLARLADAAGGRAWFPETLDELPEALRREGRSIAAGRPVERRFRPRPGPPHDILRGLEAAPLPSMDGHVAAVAREGSSVVLVSDRGAPILAGWQLGLGRVLVFTSPLGSGWTAGWPRWDSFAELWLRMVRWTVRPLARERLEPHLAVEGGRGLVALDAYDRAGRFLNGLEVTASIRSAGAEEREIPLPQTAPGRYEAAFDVLRTGSYRVAVTASGEALGGAETVLGGFYVSALPERRRRGPDRELLEAIAGAAGGEVLGAGEPPPAPEPMETAWRPAWRVPAALALLLFLLDVAARLRPGARR